MKAFFLAALFALISTTMQGLSLKELSDDLVFFPAENTLLAGAAPIITINLEAYPKLSSLEGIGNAVVELYVQTCYETNSEDKGIPLHVFNLETILDLVLQGKSIGLIFNTAAPITSKTGHCLVLTSHRDILNAENVYIPTAPPPVIIARRLFQGAA